MPCSDSSSSITIRLDKSERFVDFEFAKITCGRAIGAETGLAAYCRGKSLKDILALTFETANAHLRPQSEEAEFILYLEWDCLRCAVARYLGSGKDDVDGERCRISSIEQTHDGVEVVLVVLPPKDLAKITPCSINKDNEGPPSKTPDHDSRG